MEGGSAPGESEGQSPREVLIVDDDAITHVIFAHIIGRMRCHSRGVESGREAIEELEQRSYDLILLDAHLPDMHGAEVARAVRRGQTPNTPIIAVSSDDSEENIRLLKEAGANEFIAKPVLAQRLRELLDRWLTIEGR
jgi:CheY-like chemotaxis protein